ncbi:MAG: ferritin-like domain-containing protein [Gammaproteobacteria bacterium]|nr:ferritin-like domain-containing protein [Gammaproteobacteria bacterium]
MALIPYDICDESLLEKEAKSARLLEGIYHKGQTKIWDGNKVLDELLEKHSGITISDEDAVALKNIFSIILWGELVAWKVSLQLGAEIDDFSAKMAATSQAHDEARHFYVMKDYLDLLGYVPVPLTPAVAKVLNEVLQTKNLAKKLLGMQLMIEPVALTIFRFTRQLNIEPVLTDLLEFYEIDEARHVALGIQYLPRLIKKMNKIQLASLIVWQAKIINVEMSGLKEIENDIVSLGLDPLEVFEYAEKKQMECLELALLELGIKNIIWSPVSKMVQFKKNLTFYPDKGHNIFRRYINSFISLIKN